MFVNYLPSSQSLSSCPPFSSPSPYLPHPSAPISSCVNKLYTLWLMKYDGSLSVS